MRRRKRADGTHEAIASIAGDIYDVGPAVGRMSGAHHDMWRRERTAEPVHQLR